MSDRNRRVATRQPSLVFYDLVDTGTGERFGDLVDLSADGLMAVGEIPLAPGNRIALQMDIAARMLGTRSISFEAECRWCEPMEEPGMYACGLYVIPGSGDQIQQIPHLAATMLFDSIRSF